MSFSRKIIFVSIFIISNYVVISISKLFSRKEKFGRDFRSLYRYFYCKSWYYCHCEISYVTSNSCIRDVSLFDYCRVNLLSVLILE